jgi:hypothetical protein
MSEEQKALGHRPPSGSLASQAMAAASQHPQGAAIATAKPDGHDLQRAALEDAVEIEGAPVQVDLNHIGQGTLGYFDYELARELIRVYQLSDDARILMSEEHKALGYRPPHGSLAASAQAVASKHPETHISVDPVILAQAALLDAKKIE